MNKYSTMFKNHEISIIASDIIEAEYILTFSLGADFTGFYKITPATKTEQEKVKPFSHFLKLVEIMPYEELVSQLAFQFNPNKAYLVWEQVRRLASFSIIEKADPEIKATLRESMLSHYIFLEIAENQSEFIKELYTHLSIEKLIEKHWDEINIFKKYCILEMIRQRILESMEHYHIAALTNQDHEDIFGMILLKCFSAEEFAYWPE